MHFILNLVIIFIAGVFASSFGTLVGGGSLITIPVLILLGLPPHTALGTDRMGITGIGIAGWYKFHEKGLIDYKIGVLIAVPTLIGSFLGANIVLQIDKEVLKRIIAVITILILAFVVAQPRIGVERRRPVITKREYLMGIFFSFLVGVYGGFYGAMAATFMSYVLIFLFRQTFLESAGTGKISTFFMTLTAAVVFAMKGALHFAFGTAMFLGCCTGAFVGAHYSDKIGNVWIKRLFIVIVLIMVIRLLIS